MVNEKLNRTLDHHKYSSPLSAGEKSKDEFIKALNRLINKFVPQTFFCLTDTGNTKIMHLIREIHSHTVSLVKQEYESRCNLP